MTRLDKWLWAARFFKTRAKAKGAIEGGKVRMGGNRAKPGKELSVGDVLVIRQGFDEKTVTVVELSGQRRGAPEAAHLYEETKESSALREEAARHRRAIASSHGVPDQRPSKKQRRQIHKFKERQS